jgi:exoribonuclease-2
MEDGKVRVGIHIAAPALAIQRDDAVDQLARARMSTVYMPGDKITMLPDALVDVLPWRRSTVRRFRCTRRWIRRTGRDQHGNQIEQIPVASNLRHNDLDALVTEENLERYWRLSA